MSLKNRVKLRATLDQMMLVMEHLDRAEAALDHSAKRRHTRHRFRFRQPVGLVCHRVDGHVAFEAAPRNLSARGISVLIGAFIHPQTPCQIGLPSLVGDIVTVSGALRWCRHISRSVHEVGIEFTERVEIAEFLEVDGGANSETSVGINEFNLVLERQAMRLASLARDHRPFEEIKREFDRIRREMQRQDGAQSGWVR